MDQDIEATMPSSVPTEADNLATLRGDELMDRYDRTWPPVKMYTEGENFPAAQCAKARSEILRRLRLVEPKRFT